MQRRRKSTTSVSARTTRASRALQLDAVRRASRATLEHLENRQMLSISPTPGVTPGEGWSAAFYHDQGGGSTNPTAQDPLGDALAGNSAVPFAKKIDATIDFQGGQNGTMDGFPAFNNGANQSIRFDGYIQAPASGVMTFWSGSDDGVQVSINEGTDASPNWVTVTQRMKDARGTGTLGGGPYNEAVEVDTISAPGTNDTANSGPAFQFVAGHLYHVELAVQNGGGGWGAHLGWSGSAANLDGAAVGQIIPQSSVYLPAPSAPANVLATPVTGGGIQLTWSGGFGQTSTGPGGAATSYVVESSTNGTTWSAVGGPVTAANHADPIAYSVVDPAGTT
ncbi:MAG: glycoside hydrolase family protein, partial [Phycisphaerales bacterium]|nr:glycoside hydrolase family protein [Phycisphaerales bacterium]